MPDANIPDMPITLMNVIYVPKLNANLLLVGQMTNANIDVNFSKNHSYLSMDGEILAYGPKISNLFTYTTICTSKENNSALYATGPSGSLLWHHRLAHMNYHMIEKMAKEDVIIGFSPIMKLKVPHTLSVLTVPMGNRLTHLSRRLKLNPWRLETLLSQIFAVHSKPQ